MIEPIQPNVHAALCYVLWHHQGGSSPIGQQIRPLLGLGPHERMHAEQVEEAKRVQDISEADAVAEGSFTWAGEQETPVRDLPEARLVYRQLWEEINGPESWDANPWVWAVDFIKQ